MTKSLYQQLMEEIGRLQKEAKEKGVKYVFLYEKEVPTNIQVGLSRYGLDFVVVKKGESREAIVENQNGWGSLVGREIYKAILYAKDYPHRTS